MNPEPAELVLTPYAGGVTASWVFDAGGLLIEGATAALSLVCTQGGAEIFNAVVTTALAIPTSSTQRVSCTLTTSFDLPDSLTDPDPQNSSKNAVPQPSPPEPPEEPDEESYGLPIWLLYIATQPESTPP